MITGSRHPRIPNMNNLDMACRWYVTRTRTGRAIARTKVLFVDSSVRALRFAERAFAFHGWEAEKGQVSQVSEHEFNVELCFRPHGARVVGRNRLVVEGQACSCGSITTIRPTDPEEEAESKR